MTSPEPREERKKTFTDDQMRRYRRAFNVYDLNKNGQIECSELRAIATYMGYRLNEQQIYKIIHKLDLDERGVITFDEFLRAMPGNTEILTEEDHRRALYRQKFQEYDPDNLGHVTSKNAKRILRDELKCPDCQLEALVAQFHLADEEDMSYEDFVQFYCKVIERKEETKKAFREFDRGNKGFVSFEDAQLMMGDYGFTDAELTTLFNRHDRNKDNLLHYEEFVTFWGPQV